MTEEQLKRLHSAMLNDNEHQCNRLNNYIHTDEYLTAEVVKVVEEIVAEVTKELQEELDDEKLTSKVRLQMYNTAEEARKDLERFVKGLKNQIEKMKNCHNCKNWQWKHNRCEKKLKGDCFKASKWELAE